MSRNSSAPSFSLDRKWALGSGISLRPEPFGALAYNFGTRRLTLLGNDQLVQLLKSLNQHPTVRDALAASGLPQQTWPIFERALARLAEANVIEQLD